MKKFLKAVLFILISVFATRVWQISFLGIDAIRVGFGSLFIMLGGIFLGPMYGAFIGVSADIISFLFQPVNGVYEYLPQITVLNGLWGALPWYLFRWRKYSNHIKDLFLIIGIPNLNQNSTHSFVVSLLLGALILPFPPEMYYSFSSDTIVLESESPKRKL